MSRNDGEATGNERGGNLGNQSTCSAACSTRLQVALLVSIGFCLLYGMRCNITAAIQENMKHLVLMNEITDWNKSLEELGKSDESTSYRFTTLAPYERRAFDWSIRVIGLIDGGFFLASIVSQIPGGYLVSRLPSNLVFGCAIAISAFLNLVLPSACKVHYSFVICIRVLQGLADGVTLPACHGIWSHWAPPLERSRLVTFSLCGSYAGLVLGILSTQLLTYYWHWEVCFYVYGVLCIIWFVIWCLRTSEKPGTHKTITYTERIYIENSLFGTTSGRAGGDKKLPIPWFKVFRSLPVLVIIIASVCHQFGCALLIGSSAKYMHDVFGFEITQGGFLLVLSNVTMAIVVPIGGLIADCLRQRSILSTTAVRKLFTCAGFGLEAVILLGAAFTHDTITAIVCLNLAVGVSCFALSGFNVNDLDIAPRCASILVGSSNVFALSFVIGFSALINVFTTFQDTQSWQTMFLITSGVLVIGAIFYGVFASGDKQPWADHHNDNTTILLNQSNAAANPDLTPETSIGPLV